MAELRSSVSDQNGDGNGGGGVGAGNPGGGSGETPEQKAVRLEAEAVELRERAERAESQVDLLMNSDPTAPTVEELKTKLDQATRELAEVRTVATATKEDVRKANIKVARALLKRRARAVAV